MSEEASSFEDESGVQDVAGGLAGDLLTGAGDGAFGVAEGADQFTDGVGDAEVLFDGFAEGRVGIGQGLSALGGAPVEDSAEGFEESIHDAGRGFVSDEAGLFQVEDTDDGLGRCEGLRVEIAIGACQRAPSYCRDIGESREDDGRFAMALRVPELDLAGTDAEQTPWLEGDSFEINDVDALSGTDKVQFVEEGPDGWGRRVEAAYEFGAVEHLNGEVGVDAALELKGLNCRLSTQDHHRHSRSLDRPAGRRVLDLQEQELGRQEKFPNP